MKKVIFYCLILLSFLLTGSLIAQISIGEKLIGRILLQVESQGEAWYVNPSDLKRYYLGRPADAFEIMQKLSTGISNADLNKIPIGLIVYNDADNDNDGLSNRLEIALGTNPGKNDTDDDGYSDKLEIENNYNPFGDGLMLIDKNFANQQIGKILLQTEKSGEAWYVDPLDLKRYYLGRPADAFEIMRKLSLGITNNNLYNIVIGSIEPTPQPQSPSQVLSAAANAIRTNNKDEATSYFIPEMKKAMEHTMDFLGAENRLILGNILSGSTLSSQTENIAIFENEVYFSMGGYKIPVKFYLQKQKNDEWLLTNL
ncbi:hypothetical protein KAJ89_03480 [Candidatus Parcubacteria bacterium]|nr:hypothetical protein [Candidatus Parcubacteria bacterium]